MWLKSCKKLMKSVGHFLSYRYLLTLNNLKGNKETVKPEIVVLVSLYLSISLCPTSRIHNFSSSQRLLYCAPTYCLEMDDVITGWSSINSILHTAMARSSSAGAPAGKELTSCAQI